MYIPTKGPDGVFRKEVLGTDGHFHLKALGDDGIWRDLGRVPRKRDPRDYNVGESDYSKRTIQPWDIWFEYGLNPWDADIVKRILRNKGERRLDYEKIKHICDERIRQIDEEEQHAGSPRQTSTASQVEEPRQDSECSPER